MIITGNIVDILGKKINEGNIHFANGTIQKIELIGNENKSLPYILPGFVDAHIHIESSMLTPSQFARMAVVHGTVATISDPHEIANVCGMQGVEFMINDGNTVPFKFNFGAPSCVPATIFETAGATITVQDVDTLLQRNDIKYLSEMMNFPGVLNGDADVMAKIALAQKYKKPVDGHAPGLRGKDAFNYIQGISLTPMDATKSPPLGGGGATDHECFTAEEALCKLHYGMKILIREGSAAKNFDALIDLLHDWEDMIMFCSDDKHPDSLEVGHINELCARAVTQGIDVFKVLKAACINPVLHYKLEVGLLQHNDAADFIIVNNLQQFKTLQTYINGTLVAENGISKIETKKSGTINNFNCNAKGVNDFVIDANTYNNEVPVIVALDGQLITQKLMIDKALLQNGDVLNSNVENDVLKIVVVNRYSNAPVAKAFIKNFGLQRGALASSVAHDSHNIVAVGVDDDSICEAVNLVIENRGGLTHYVSNVNNNIDVQIPPTANGGTVLGGGGALPLPIAGIMTNEDGYAVSKQYTAMDNYVKQQLGSTLLSPYMTLSFMALLVIPHLKLSDKGLFNGDTFSFV
jgi:adenine deaminase